MDVDVDGYMGTGWWNICAGLVLFQQDVDFFVSKAVKTWSIHQTKGKNVSKLQISILKSFLLDVEF